ncbi:MAG: hypothetical protein ACFNP5_08320 [Hoylesella saccharolytica]
MSFSRLTHPLINLLTHLRTSPQQISSPEDVRETGVIHKPGDADAT